MAGCARRAVKGETAVFVRDGAAQRRRGGAALECGVRSARMRAQRFCVFDAAARSAPARLSNLCPAQSNLTAKKLNPTIGGNCFASGWCSRRVMPFGRRFHRMAPRSEPLEHDQRLGSNETLASIAFQAARTRAVIVSGIGADSGSKGCLRGDLAKGKGSPEARAALGDLSQDHACPHPPGPRGERPRGNE